MGYSLGHPSHSIFSTISRFQFPVFCWPDLEQINKIYSEQIAHYSRGPGSNRAACNFLLLWRHVTVVQCQSKCIYVDFIELLQNFHQSKTFSGRCRVGTESFSCRFQRVLVCLHIVSFHARFRSVRMHCAPQKMDHSRADKKLSNFCLYVRPLLGFGTVNTISELRVSAWRTALGLWIRVRWFGYWHHPGERCGDNFV